MGCIRSASAPTSTFHRYAEPVRDAAAAAWAGLFAQEERSRLTTIQLVTDLLRAGAPLRVLEAARRVASEEAKHVELCANVIRGLGREVPALSLRIRALPADDVAFEQALVELLVAGFAVAETLSVGAFLAVREVASEPLVRWTLGEIARDEVGHGRFGELAGAWALAHWSEERRGALWPLCVSAMEDVERRAGGPAVERSSDESPAATTALGVPKAGTASAGLLRTVPKAVLPRLRRLGVLSDSRRRGSS